MKYFTQDEMNPSEKTLQIIKQIAYTYRTIKKAGGTHALCLN
jgi:hypothetical protein